MQANTCQLAGSETGAPVHGKPAEWGLTFLNETACVRRRSDLSSALIIVNHYDWNH